MTVESSHAGGRRPALTSHAVKVSEHPDVHRIAVPFKNVSTDATNCYLVVDGGEALLIDTGAPTDEGFAVLDAALDELGVDRAHLSVFLTHLHFDHAGLVGRVLRPGGVLYVARADLDVAVASRRAGHAETAQAELVRQGFATPDAVAYARYAVEGELFDAARYDVRHVAEGDEVHVGRYSLRVVETPGHTPGHVALFEPASRILFAGDHVLFVISPGIALMPDAMLPHDSGCSCVPSCTDTMAQYLRSLEKVRALGCTRLFIAHGDERSDFDVRIDHLLAHHRARLEETTAIVKADPGLTGAQAIRRIRWGVRGKAWDDVPFLQRWCIVAQGIAVLNHLLNVGCIVRRVDDAGVYRYFPAEQGQS